MKKLLYGIYVLVLTLTTGLYNGLFNSSRSASTMDFRTLYAAELPAVANLATLTQGYFDSAQTNINRSQQPTMPVAMLTDPKRQAMRFTIRRLLGLALDTHQPLDFLADYGLVKNSARGQTDYLLYYDMNPLWAGFDELFSSFGPEYLRRYGENLVVSGLDETDIIKLKDFWLNNDPIIKEFETHMNVIDQQSQVLMTKLLAIPDHDEQQIRQVKRQVGKTTHELWRQSRVACWDRWGEGLLANLSPVKQQILVNFAQRQLGFAYLGPAPISEYALLKLSNELLAGTAKSDVQFGLDSARRHHDELIERYLTLSP